MVDNLWLEEPDVVYMESGCCMAEQRKPPSSCWQEVGVREFVNNNCLELRSEELMSRTGSHKVKT